MMSASGICRYCGCTDAQPCDGGCGWTDEARTVCSWCAPARELASVLQEAVRGRPELLTSSLDGDQAPLVMVMRALLNAARDRVLEGEGPDVGLAAFAELSRLADALQDRFPDEADVAQAHGEGPVDLALRLLPATPPRIILATDVLGRR